MLDELFHLSREFLNSKNQAYRRFFLTEHDLKERFSILTGQRGVGKTTIIIQHLLDYVGSDYLSKKILYIQADHFAVGQLSLYDIAEAFFNMGGEFIAFDEIHKYDNWSQELKSIHDTFTTLKMIASGSSALEIHKGSHDLSRRALIYNVPEMSFREYLELEHGFVFPKTTLEDIIKSHVNLVEQLRAELATKAQKPLPLFESYKKHGYYPFYRELNDENKFKMALEQNVHTTLESDLTAIYPKLTHHSIKKVKQLLSFIAEAVPFKPNWASIKSFLEIGDERTLKNYFKYLEDAQLIATVYKASKQLFNSTETAKVYLKNPNLMYAICLTQQNTGTTREIFFLNMLSKDHKVSVPSKGDFLVDNNYTFEVGGKKKDDSQITGIENACLAVDNIEVGFRNRIPLYLFGLLY